MEGLEEGGDLVLMNIHIHDIHTKIHAYIHTKGNKYKINASILRNSVGLVPNHHNKASHNFFFFSAPEVILMSSSI